MAKKKTKNKFQHPVGRLRKKVREVLVLAPGYWFTETAITDLVNELLEPDAPISDVRLAIEWNYSEDYVQCQQNEETETKEWATTKAGIARENL